MADDRAPDGPSGPREPAAAGATTEPIGAATSTEPFAGATSTEPFAGATSTEPIGAATSTEPFAGATSKPITAATSTEPINAAAPRGWARWRWHLLGVFVIYHIAAVVLQALPDPGGTFSKQAWRDPTVQQEFAVWSQWLTRSGYAITPRQLESRLWVLANQVATIRAAIIRPFYVYGHHIGVRQPWRMFVAPHRFPTSLEVAVRDGGEWRTIFADRSPEYTWRRGIFDHDRMRAAIFRYGWPNYRSAYSDLALWITRQVARDFPSATEARIRMLKRRTPTPEEVRGGAIPEGNYQQETVMALEGKR